jgi:hypothetical protein
VKFREGEGAIDLDRRFSDGRAKPGVFPCESEFENKLYCCATAGPLYGHLKTLLLEGRTKLSQHIRPEHGEGDFAELRIAQLAVHVFHRI